MEAGCDTGFAQQRSVLQWLTARIETVASEVSDLPARRMPSNAPLGGSVTPPGRGAAAAPSSVSSPPGSIPRAPSWESMVSEAGGYKTAEEEAADERDSAASSTSPAPSPATAPPRELASAAAAGGGGGGGGGAATPPASGWAGGGAGNDGSWSCIGSVDAGTPGAAARGGAAGSSTSDGAAPAREAANAAVLEKADELYTSAEYEAAASLLQGEGESVEVLWRRCRLCKELADVAKAGGNKKQQEALLYEVRSDLLTTSRTFI